MMRNKMEILLALLPADHEMKRRQRPESRSMLAANLSLKHLVLMLNHCFRLFP